MRLSSRVIKSPVLEPGQPVSVKRPACPVGMGSGGSAVEEADVAPAEETAAGQMAPAEGVEDGGLLEEMERAAESILERARTQADVLVRTATGEAERVRQEAAREGALVAERAREEGFRSGREQGLLAAREAVGEIMREVALLRERAEKEKEAALAALEPQLVELALSVAEKVLRVQIEVKPEVVTGLVRDAVAKVQGMKKAVVRVHEQDVDIVRAQQDAIVSGVEGLEQFEVVADRSIERGGCVVETDQGCVDATIARQLARIEELLKEVKRNGWRNMPTA